MSVQKSRDIFKIHWFKKHLSIPKSMVKYGIINASKIMQKNMNDQLGQIM